MTRWWSSPDQGVAVLRSVDDSDVRQGVGTALLGYHALSQGVLKPLTQATLVDVSKVFRALDEIDLEPVSKAISEATKPVLGDGSAKYGELLAQDIHESAKAATERLILSWTQTGMPWPHAIERAAEVHGVPLSRLGRYASQMKAPVTPLVRQDVADRVLMEYASELGWREAGNAEDIAKSQQFEEHEHPRGEGGRFRTKSTREERMARRDRRQRRQVRQETQRVEQQRANLEKVRENVRAQVDALMNIFEATKPVEQAPMVQQGMKQTGMNQSGLKQTGLKQVNTPLVEQQQALVPVEQAEEEPTSDIKGKTQSDYVHRLEEAVYMLVPVDAIKDHRKFDPFSIGMNAITEDRLAEELKSVDPQKVIAIRFNRMAVQDTEGSEYVPVKGMKYNIDELQQWEKTVAITSGLSELEITIPVFDADELDIETPAEAERRRSLTPSDILENQRLATARADNFLQQKVTLLNEDDFAVAHNAYVSDFLNDRSQVHFAWKYNDVGSERPMKMEQAIHRVQRDKNARISPKNPWNHLESSEWAAVEGAKQEMRFLEQNFPLKNLQASYEVRQMGTNEDVYAPLVVDYSRAEKQVMLVFDNEEDRRAYDRGDYVAFETVATEGLSELYRHYDIDPQAANRPPDANLDPPITAFRVRQATSDEMRAAERREEW